MAQPVELPAKIEVGPVIDEGHSLASVSDKIGGIVLKRKITIGWVFGFLIAFGVMQCLLGAATWLFVKGVGIWGINIPVGWGFAIVNFVWWIGIGHAGTLISAILLLLNQSWRNAINRFAEAMTLFAVHVRGHVPGAAYRPSVAGLLAVALSQYDGPLAAVPQSAGVGRVRGFDVSHDFGGVLVRRSCPGSCHAARFRKAALEGSASTACSPWAGAVRRATGRDTKRPSLLLAGLATPLVVSVHTVVSFDFAVAMLPGWHTTIFPPYFVAGAIYSGFAMVLTLMIPVRTLLRPRRHHHDSPSEQHGEGHAGDRPDRWLRLHDGGVLRLLQRRHLREVHDRGTA